MRLMRNPVPVCAAFLLLLGFLSPNHAQGSTGLLAQFEKRVQEFTLDNGMTVLFLRCTVAPVVSFEMNFKAGGIDEISGKTGLAHLSVLP